MTVLELPGARRGERIIGDRPKLWTPKGAHLGKLMDDYIEQEYRAHGAADFPRRPVKDAQGNVNVYAPLNLLEEIELFLREERLKRYAQEIGLRFIEGGDSWPSSTMWVSGGWSFLTRRHSVST